MFRLVLIFAFVSFVAVTDTALSKSKAKRDVAPGKVEEGGFVIEKRSDGSTVKYKKTTQYDFEGANIDGLYNKPSGAYISNIKDVKGKAAIKIRENFDAEVADSARQVK